MTPGIIYRLEFINTEGFTVRTDISPQDIPISSGDITDSATFIAANQLFLISTIYSSFFYVGQVLTITGTASNNQTVTVINIIYGIVIFVTVDVAVVDESAASATFTDQSPYTETNIIALKGGADPVIISASNNDEDKFTQIRSKSARITFRSDSASGLDSSTFSQGGDNLFRVDIYLQDTPTTIFSGFLMMADNQQPFQPDPQYVTLTATDHLAALKEIALVDFDGINPLGKYRVAELLAFCLQRTGLLLDIFVVNNLRAGGGQFTKDVTFAAAGDTITFFSDADVAMFYEGQRIVISSTVSNNISTYVSDITGSVVTVTGSLVDEVKNGAVFLDYNSQFHWYDVVYLDAKTFESEIGECENCYDVLNKILGEDCFITQWKGNWWILRTDELDSGLIYVAEFDSGGTYVSTAAGTTYGYSIGAVENSKFANADTLLRFVRPHNFIKETFDFTTPLEIPCNIDFERGAVIDDVLPEKTYTLDCWDLLEGGPGIYGTVDGTTATIHRIYNDLDYEIERYIVLTPRTTYETSSLNDATYIQSEAIPVNIKDIFSVSVDYKLTNNSVGIATERLMRAVLSGDDGSFWILGEATIGDGIPLWWNTSVWTANTGKGTIDVDFEADDWVGISWDAPAVPVAGNVYIWLNQLNQNPAAYDSHDIWYSNLRFDYNPYINGTYARYSGQYSKVTRTETGYFANRDKQVYISDSPTKLYKGSMFLYSNSVYILFPIWFNYAQFAGYPTDEDDLHPYGYIQAFSVWNQYKGFNDPTTGRGIGINIFAGSVLGLTSTWPDLLHKYSLTDLNVQTNDRYFMLISMEQNWKTCIWGATFIEVYNTAIGKTYSDTFEFKYISG